MKCILEEEPTELCDVWVLGIGKGKKGPSDDS